MRNYVRAWAGVAVLAAVAASGCSSDHASVAGTVMVDGEPLKMGTVTFHPSGEGPLAYGTVADSGRFRLSVGTDEGLPPGEYAVTVAANEPPPPPKTPPKIGAGAPAPGKSLVPLRYRSKETSGLKFTVKSGSNTIDLPLASK